MQVRVAMWGYITFSDGRTMKAVQSKRPYAPDSADGPLPPFKGKMEADSACERQRRGSLLREHT